MKPLTDIATPHHVRNRGGLLVLALAVSQLIIAPQIRAQYYVSVAPGGHFLNMTLAMPPWATERVLLPPRLVSRGAPSQVSDVKCSLGTLEHGPEGVLKAPSECALVTWKAAVDPVSSNMGALASGKRSLSFEGGRWFLLAGPASILELSGVRHAGDITSVGPTKLLGPTPVGENSFKLPTPATEFYVLGSPHTSRRHVGSLSITDVEDDPERVQKLGLKTLHSKALGYLTRIVPMPAGLPDSERSLLIVWIGASRTLGGAEGFAGARSFLANYILDDEANEDTNTAVTTMLIAHEQFHQLVNMLRGNEVGLTPWLNESLAQYYALKALTLFDKSDAAQTLRSNFINPEAVISHGLLELNRTYEQEHTSDYSLFYSQGATFLSLVDQAIQSESAGKLSLDDFLADLLTGPVNDDGTLPPAFVARIQAIVGPRMQDLLARYVSASGK